MGASASLSQASLDVDAGGEVGLDLQIKNTGAVVDEFTIEVLGPTAPWATPVPPSVSLFPEASGTIHITFRPPRAPTTTAGITPFGIMVHSGEDPSRSSVEEGVLHVAPYLEPSAELIPRTSRGSRGGQHELAIDNRGNVAFDADLLGEDPDRLVGFEFEPPAVSVAPGTAGFAKLKVKPAQTFWRGPSKTRSFQVQVKPRAEAQPPLQLAGTMLQESILPPWFMRALITALMVIIGLILLWLFVLQPQIKSSAAQVLSDFGYSPLPSKAPGSTAPSAGPSLAPSAAASPSGGASPAAPSPAASVGPTTAPSPSESTAPSPSEAPSPSKVGPSGPGGPTPVPTVVPTPSRAPTPTPVTITPPPVTPTPSNGVAQFPVSVRLDSKAGSYQAATNTQLFVTDLVFSNPTGASGSLILQVNGKTILSLKLDNFRDLDFHFVTPIVVNGGQVMRLIPGCAGGGACDPAVLFSGYLQASN